METQVTAGRERSQWSEARGILPFLLNNENERKLDLAEINKLEMFEKGLAEEIVPGDTIEQSITKMVRMALAAEFGPTLVAASGAKKMIDTITNAIMKDDDLRKQALIIIERFSKDR